MKIPSKRYVPKEVETKIQKFWKEEQIYEKVKKFREKGENYYFVDGPPYTTGYIHLGTAWNKVIKDAVVRYRRMCGYNVRDQAGFDMHGLPIEVKVEQTLKIKNKKEIEEYGVENFIEKCRNFALDFQKQMTVQFSALGVWLDWENPYLTIENKYIEAAWWTLKKAYEKNLLIQSERVLSWCPRCETALAEAEIEYWDESDPSIYVKFPLKGKKNEYILIWTTTPWTLPSNLAVAVHPDFNYVRVAVKKEGREEKESKEEILIVLEERLEDIVSIGKYANYRILDSMKGKELEGLEYEQPLMELVDYHKTVSDKWAHKILLGEIVTAENTGCVHIAPGHGPDDFELGKKYGIKPFCPISESGKFNSEVKKWMNIHVKEADKDIIQYLKNKNLMLHDSKITHRYGHCWRCKTPIIYRTTSQWFLRVSELREKMLEEIKKIKWTPEWAGNQRFFDWVQNTRDWCISRQRYWGIPIPIWVCGCGEKFIAGSAADLKRGSGYKNNMDLHRPAIDNVTFSCKKCGKNMKRVNDILDVWFDSAIASWATLDGYDTNSGEFKKWWPCKWITEAHDQTRGWFYSQLGASMAVFDKSPYESVLMHGFALDEKGQPMSKSLGNVIAPLKIADQYGMDSLRFYLLRASAPWEDMPFSLEGVKNANKMLNVLWNVFLFATTYMELDKFDGEVGKKYLDKLTRPEDKWLLSRVENLKKNVTAHIESYELHKACRELEHFILEDLSRWYVKLIRDRTWVEGKSEDKMHAYAVLYESLATVTKLLAPITPHISEEIYAHIDGSKKSAHMCDWPQVSEGRINKQLEIDMKVIQEIVEDALNGRQQGKLKLRWPAIKINIKPKEGHDNEVIEAVKLLQEILMEQTNTKEVGLVKDDSWINKDHKVELNKSEIGKKFGKNSMQIFQDYRKLAEDKVRSNEEAKKVKAGKDIVLGSVNIPASFFTIKEELPSTIIATESTVCTCYVNVEITEAIESEGFAREAIRRVQEMRKELNLNVEDFIKTKIWTSKKIENFLNKWKEFIGNETRSKDLKIAEIKDGDAFSDEIDLDHKKMRKNWNVEGEKIVIEILKN
ncbi:MAG: isoleucine--tRNA ligase [Thermoplasmata archaeon]